MSDAAPVFVVFARGTLAEDALLSLRMAVLPMGIAAGGGGLEIAIGEPALKQSDARRAVQAAEWMRDAARRAGTPLPVGIAFGARGAASAAARRLADGAAGGEIVAGTAVADATTGEFAWEPAGAAHRLLPEGRPALLDLRRRAAAPPPPPGALEAVRAALDAGRSVWIAGPPGSGKSTLLDALEASLPAPVHPSPAAAALAAAVPRLPRTSGLRTGREPHAVLAALGRIVTGNPMLDPAGADWEAIFRRPAGVRGAPLAVDDAHAAEPATLDRIGRLALAGGMFVLAGRPGPVPPEGFRVVELPPAPARPPAEIPPRLRAALADAAAFGAVFQPDRLAAAVGRVAGNAFDDAWRLRLLEREEGSPDPGDPEYVFRLLPPTPSPAPAPPRADK